MITTFSIKHIFQIFSLSELYACSTLEIYVLKYKAEYFITIRKKIPQVITQPMISSIRFVKTFLKIFVF